MSEREAPQPLGPSSLTWKYFGDRRGLALALWAGSLQNMHPGLGAGVEEHSGFFDERWERLHRSLYPIIGVVYDGPAAARTARAVRGYHDTVKGVDRQGRPYHALDPDTFYWAHATFFMSTVVLADRLAGGLTEEQKEQLFRESVQWYALYGVSMRPVPADWAAFERYWDHMCAEVLEVNPAALAVLDIGRIGRPPVLGWLPGWAWAGLRPLVVRPFRWMTVGLYLSLMRPAAARPTRHRSRRPPATSRPWASGPTPGTTTPEGAPVRSCPASYWRTPHCRMLTARATTRRTVSSDTTDCRVISSFAQVDSGIVSVGLKAVALVKAT